MHIALVTYALQLGGIETFLLRLWRFLKANGHDASIIQTEERGAWENMFKDEGCPVINVIANPLRSRLHHASRIAETLRRCDLVLLNDAPFAQAVLGLLSERTPALAIVHSDMQSMYRNATGNFGQWDAVVGVSPKLVDTLITSYKVPPELAHMIPYGVEVADTYPHEPGQFADIRPLKVVFAGRIENTQKGVFRLPGISSLALSRGADIEMHIIGDGPDLPQLRLLFGSACPNMKAVFHGAMTPADTRRLLGECHVMILPSNFEGFPIIVLEAMASGTVPVVSRLAGMTDRQIDHLKNGWLCEPADLDGFAHALVELGSKRSILQEMSRKAWQTALEKFSVAQMEKSYLELINRLVLKRSHGDATARSGKIDPALLGDLPHLPVCAVRPMRKLHKLLHMPSPAQS